MKLSARNVMKGKVKAIKHGQVMTEITIELPSGTEIIATITKESADNLQITQNMEINAIIKASNVMVMVD